MSYLTETSKWNAYQFNDPFASDKFIVCNKSSKICCRPNCDLSLQTSLKSEVVFVNDVDEAVNAGFIKCPHCLISNDDHDLNTISIDVDLLIKTVATVNAQIGFVPPLDDDDPECQNIREAAMRKNKLRRGSVPAIHLNSTTASKNTSSNITKNETDHVKLVDLACRHIALAAASTALQIHEDQNNIVRQQLRLHEQQQQQLQEDKVSGNKKRRRRGGVLGFKELANKSKLSPWHFHRVFKSVTGLTPKVYGDRCWEFVKKYIDRHGSMSLHNTITMSTSITNPTSAPPDEQTTGANTINLAKLKASKVKLPETEILSPSETDTNKRDSPFSTTTMEDLINTPHSTSSVVGNSYTSPVLSQKPGVDFTQYTMLPSTNDLLLEQLTLNNSLAEPMFNNDTTQQLNSFDILYNDQQPQFQDYQIKLPLQKQDPHTRSASVPNQELNLKELELPKFDLNTQARDWNLQQSQQNLNLYPFNQDITNLNSTTSNNNNYNDQFINSLDISSNVEKAYSDSGDYVQTPFNFDLNAYGYFGDFSSLDPLETPRPTLEFMS